MHVTILHHYSFSWPTHLDCDRCLVYSCLHTPRLCTSTHRHCVILLSNWKTRGSERGRERRRVREGGRERPNDYQICVLKASGLQRAAAWRRYLSLHVVRTVGRGPRQEGRQVRVQRALGLGAEGQRLQPRVETPQLLLQTGHQTRKRTKRNDP